MLCDQTTSSSVIINTDIYTKYDTIIIPSVTNTPPSINNFKKQIIYPTMFDRWRDI